MLTPARTITLFLSTLTGVLAAQAWQIGDALAEPIKEGSQAFLMWYVTTTLLVLIIYAHFRGASVQLLKILKSGRIDLLTALLLGVSVAWTFRGASKHLYHTTTASLDYYHALAISGTPIALAIILICQRAFSISRNRFIAPETTSPLFIPDLEKNSKSEDLLDISGRASVFAERLLNGGSHESLVFGLDAPWGIGKSSFINFCIEHWDLHHSKKVIIYRFTPLRHADDDALLVPFVDGISRAIRKSVFIPEIRPLMKTYSRYIGGQPAFSFFGLQASMYPNKNPAVDALDDLEKELSRLGKQIIVIVDDLDRISFSAIRRVMFTIKKGLSLPNITYVLCYDSNNIVTNEKDCVDQDKVSEFLEKFVNVKFSIFLSCDALAHYASENINLALSENSQADPYLVSQSVAGLLDIYRSPNFHMYQPFVGDIRKLKRLLNAVLLLGIERTDFDRTDFNKKDLINLLLIYINFPSTFRKLYDTETHGKRGFFCLRTKRNTGASSSNLENSEEFIQYLESTAPNEKFLLEELFRPETRLGFTNASQLEDEQKYTFACFNGIGSQGENLRAYLELIAQQSQPDVRFQHNFYVDAKRQIEAGTPIAEILKNEKYSKFMPDDTHLRLWKTLVNSSRSMPVEIVETLIHELVNRLPRYSLIELRTPDIGAREELVFLLIKLLDNSAASSWHRHKKLDKSLQIADLIFGNGKHADSGIVDSLCDPTRGPTGFNDLMIFRLYCCINRGGNIFNLTHALIERSDPTAPTEGLTDTIVVPQMRELSQYVFARFREQYIEPRKNLFSAIDALPTDEMLGDWAELTMKAVEDASITAETLVTQEAVAKSKMKSFIAYQLGNELTTSGAGCGFYDEAGAEDRRGIRTRFNHYLFDVCFTPAPDNVGYLCFLDFLLCNQSLAFDSHEIVSTLSEFTKVLNEDLLKAYWQQNKGSLTQFISTHGSRSVVTPSYTATYSRDLPQVFSCLDSFADLQAENSQGSDGRGCEGEKQGTE